MLDLPIAARYNGRVILNMIFKIVIKAARNGRALARPAMPLLAAALLLWAPTTRAAEQVFYSPRAILTDFFPRAEEIHFQRFALTAGLLGRITQRLGYAPRKRSYVFYVAQTAGHTDGYAIIDDEVGQTEPITFAVRLSPSGVVERAEVLVYREPRGDEVRGHRFLDQLRGKTVQQAVRAGVDVDAVSGATISCFSITTGVRRALVLFDELIAHPHSETARFDLGGDLPVPPRPSQSCVRASPHRAGIARAPAP
jgi:hypothetical protein